MALLKLKERVIDAFAATRDIKKFQQLSDELQAVFGKNWAVSGFKDARESLERGSLDGAEAIIVCVDSDDETNLEPIEKFITDVRARKLHVILLAGDVSPGSLHRLMRLGANEFIPYPMPADSLSEAVTRLRDTAKPVIETPHKPVRRKTRGLILPVYGVAGGVGTTTFATNLAWEMANHSRKDPKKVVLLDLNFQTGSAATYLDLARRDSVYDLLTDAEAITDDVVAQALTSFKTKLAVMTAPPEILPLDIISPDQMHTLLTKAQEAYDFVIVDMPTSLVHWSSTVLQMAETYFTILELDMRCAQNTMRFLKALKAEDLPDQKLQFALNYAPSFTDLNGKARAKRFSESLGIDINIFLPDGGKQIVQCCDQGVPLSEGAGKNALRKEIRKIAASLITMAEEQKAAIA